MRVVMLLLICFSILKHGTEATKILQLNENWMLQNEDGDIKLLDVRIPSGIYSDLENANITESILFFKNDVALRTYGKDMNWIYSTSFSMTTEDLDHEFVILTFHGLDTIANIYLNNETLGNTDNMFRRYRYNIKSFVNEGENHLSIHFNSPVKVAKELDELMERKIPPACPPNTYKGECHMNMLRKMQASFAWDWGLAAPSMGIWKEIDIELYDSVNIRDVTYELSSTIEDIAFSKRNNSEFWQLNFKIYVESGLGESEHQGILTYEISGIDGPHCQRLTIFTDSNGEKVIDVTMKIMKSSVQLWWPNGYGDQKLYTFKVKWEDERVNSVNYYSKIYLIAEKTINVGFRTVQLMQDQTDNGLLFYFRVNNIPIFMKGSNWIPAHVLPERTADEVKVKELLQATRDAHMNMLRVWGGGVYESDYFYNLADKYGILIWQDMMFACAMYPAGKFLDSVRYEIRDQIKRIQHHPSIALFATNNENEVALRQNWYKTNTDYEAFAQDYKELYVDTITDEIRKYDASRKILTSSPSNGDWKIDRDQFGISVDPQSVHFGDIHYYPLNTNSWLPTTFHSARFASEYGFQSYPYGWEEVVPNDDEIEDLISHRQHHPLNSTLLIFLIQENLNVEFESLNWKDKVYLSQVSQAIALKTETEVYRTGRGDFLNTMGALYWQLNDVWVAPSWSSIEYNGNFKIVHYWMEKLFRSISLSTQVKQLNKLTINVISDEINVEPKNMTVRMNMHRWSSIEIVETLEWKFNLTPNAVTKVEALDIYKFMNDKGIDVYKYLLMFYLYDDNDMNNAIDTNFVFPANYQHLKAVKEPNVTAEFSSNKCENSLNRISMTIKTERPALFVHIVLNHPEIKKYKLSNNGFIQVEPVSLVQLTFTNPDCALNVTVDAIDIRTLNKYLM